MRKADLILGVVVAAIGSWALATALDLTAFGKHHVPGPGLFPDLVSAGLLGLGVLLAALSARGLLAQRKAVSVGHASPVLTGEATGPSEVRRELRAGSVFLCYVASMPLLTVLGFVPACAIFVVAVLFVIEGRRNWKSLAAAVLIPVACHVIFVQLLTIQLPNGPFGHGPLGI